jgi:RNA polymerase sigma-70 factor (ECF subfamily)
MTRFAEDQKEATDEMLMVRYQRGYRDAFAALVTRHAPTVFSVGYYLLNSEAQADKLAQDTFLQVVRDAATFHLEAQFRTWLFGLLHRGISEYCASMPEVGDSQPTLAGSVSSPTTGPESAPPISSRSYHSQILTRRVANRVRSLPFPMREVFLFKQTGQLGLASIATAIGVDVDTVRHLMRGAFERIQDCVADTEEYARALR